MDAFTQKIMGAYFIDLDGVFFKHGTMEVDEKTILCVQQLMALGHQVYFTTKRHSINNEPDALNIINTKKTLQNIKVPYTGIIEGVSSPRIIINDEGCQAIRHKRNKSLSSVIQLKDSEEIIIQKIFNAFSMTAWVSVKYDSALEVDEFVQTIAIAKSLISSSGYNHRDLVRRYRQKIKYIFREDLIPEGGIYHYYGQIYKLLKSKDPLYLAQDGVSDGAAMKMLPVAAYYYESFEELVKNVDRITLITHNSVEARLSAILIALRYRQIFIEEDKGVEVLFKDVKSAIVLLHLEEESRFFLDQLKIAKQLVLKFHDPEKLLVQLLKKIGLDYLCWSTPVTACFWSFRADNNFNYWFKPVGYKKFKISERVVDYNFMSKGVLKKYKKQLQKIGQYESYLRAHKHHFGKRNDVDTFYSIAFGLIAAERGVAGLEEDIKKCLVVFGEDVKTISRLLVKKDRKFTFSLKIEINYLVYIVRKKFAKINFFLTPQSLLDHIQLHWGIKSYFKKLKSY